MIDVQRVAQWLAGPIHRPVLAASALMLVPLLTPLTLAVPLLLPVALAIPAFVALVHGMQAAWVTVGGSSLLLAVLGLVTGLDPVGLGGSALSALLMSAALGGLVARSGSLNLGFQAALLVGALAAAVFAAGIDMNEVREFITVELRELAAARNGDPTGAAQMAEIAARLFVGFAVSGLVLTLMLGLFLARALEAAHRGRDGGFAAEFRGLRSGLIVTVAASAVFVLAPITGWLPLVNAAVVFATGFLLQGLAVVHRFAALANWNAGWLLIVYVLLLVAPLAGVMVAAAGYLDNWFDWRRKPAP